MRDCENRYISLQHKTINMDTTNYTSASAAALPNGTDNNNIKASAKTVATAVIGATIGSGFPFIIGKVKESVSELRTEEATNEETATPVEWADGNISVASGVNDEMSFSEAFAAARSEVGAGGAFEWRGNVYGTYYAEEWNSISPAEKADFNNHFSWNNIDTSSVNGTTHTDVTTNHDDIEIVSVDHGQTPSSVGGDSTVEVVSAEPEIEVLGVVHDMSTGSNIGGLSVDGQDVFLIDVDGDLEFDLMASDINQNNVVDEGEVVNIHGQGMSVNDLGGISGITESMTGEDTLPDYMADNTYEI